MRIGAAAVDITPKVPCHMAGYAARTGEAEGVHDPLTARAISFDDGKGGQAVMIVADLISVDRELTEETRQAVARALGMEPSHVMLEATHTHGGPVIAAGPFWPEGDPQYQRGLVERFVHAAEQAAHQSRPARLYWGETMVENVATNRHDPRLPFVPALTFCFVESEAGEPLVWFGSFPCHPTVMGADNRQITADLPGAFRRALDARFRERWLGAAGTPGVEEDETRGPVVILMTGAAGDVSTRFVRKGQNFEEVERLGGILAAGAWQGLDGRTSAGQEETPVPTEVRVWSERVRLPRKKPEDFKGLEDQVASFKEELERRRAEGASPGDLRVVETAIQGAEGALRVAEQPDVLPNEGEVQLIGLGRGAVCSIPGELFSSLGREIATAGGEGRPVLVAGYTNSYLGYLPDRSAFAEARYEVLISPLAEGAAEMLTGQAKELVQHWKGAR